jgi:hypothetical protein
MAFPFFKPSEKSNDILQLNKTTFCKGYAHAIWKSQNRINVTNINQILNKRLEQIWFHLFLGYLMTLST